MLHKKHSSQLTSVYIKIKCRCMILLLELKEIVGFLFAFHFLRKSIKLEIRFCKRCSHQCFYPFLSVPKQAIKFATVFVVLKYVPFSHSFPYLLLRKNLFNFSQNYL